MNQLRFFSEPAAAPAAPKERTPSTRPVKFKSRIRAYDAANREAAEIIVAQVLLSDTERYDGLPLEWVKATMEKQR